MCFLSFLLQLKRAGIELVIRALLGDEAVVAAALNDAAMVKHHDDIGVHDRGEPVGDDEHRAPLHELIHALLDNGLGMGVD